MKKGDFVKIKNAGIGKIDSTWDDKNICINIAGTNYYRDLKTDQDIKPATKEEYIIFLKLMLKELTNVSKSKRKEAAEYNKEVSGIATQRKGKVTVINGNIYGMCENNISSHHRSLLTDAKKAKELKDKLKEEIAYYKEQEAFRKSIGL